MEIIELIVSVLGGATLLISSAAWLASKFVESRLKQDLETHKAALKARYDSQLEGMKSELQLALKEREVALNWLHERRAGAIETLYAAIVDLQSATRIILDIFSPRNPQDIREYTKEARQRVHSVYETYQKARIFLTPDTCEKIEEVLDAFQSPITKYQLFLVNYDDDELHTLNDVKDDAWDQIQELLPGALRNLEEDFRNVLGVTKS